MLALAASTGASAYVLETELTGGVAGEPPQDLHKVTITLPSDPANDPGDNMFTVNWLVPKEQTEINPDTGERAPADLTAAAKFTITDFDSSTVVMDISLNNTFDPALGINSLVAFGFFIDPDVDTAQLSNYADPNSILWEAKLDDQLTGNFKNLDICVFPDETSSSCNGGSVNNGLPAGASDLLTLTLTGDFASPSDGEEALVMLSEFPVKFQGDWGSFQVPGATDCCDTPPDGQVPEPATTALLLGGLAVAYPLGRRRQRLKRQARA